MDWTSCYGSDKISWLHSRDSFLYLFLNPQISIFLIWTSIFAFTKIFKFKFIENILLTSILTLTISLIYTPFATSEIEHFLNKQSILYNYSDFNDIDLILIPGRGEKIAKFTTNKAKSVYQEMNHPYIYISGDDKSTGFNLVKKGLDINKISGDSCAQTTLENIYFTQKWIKNKSLEGKIFIITDKWHLPRISRTFFANNIKVAGFGVNPNFSKRDENKIAIRELLAYFLYKLQARLEIPF